MADITMCLEHDCPRRNDCYRYTSKPNVLAQSYFNVGGGVIVDYETCEFFIPNHREKAENLSNERRNEKEYTLLEGRNMPIHIEPEPPDISMLKEYIKCINESLDIAEDAIYDIQLFVQEVDERIKKMEQDKIMVREALHHSV